MTKRSTSQPPPAHGEAKLDVRERGANAQTSERRLFMQLQSFGGCVDPKPLVAALERSRLEAAGRIGERDGAHACLLFRIVYAPIAENASRPRPFN